MTSAATQQCKACQRDLPLDAFYDRARTCKRCKCAQVKAYRDANIETVRARDRRRGRSAAHRARVVAYQQTERGRERLRVAKNLWASRNALKKAAHTAISNALRDGALHAQPCEVCGSVERVDAHHDDYGKPLDVRWLCRTHHAEHHRLLREQERHIGNA